MKNYNLLFIGLVFIFSFTSCNDDVDPAGIKYQVTFQANWSSMSHPTDYPSNPHFSPLIGLTHGTNALFSVGDNATPGIKNMAETGGTSPLNNEINTIINNGGGLDFINAGGVSSGTGSRTFMITVDDDNSYVTIVSMIAPSPDWFLGVNKLNLKADNDFVQSLSVDVNLYDSGTDSGVSFTSGNLPTSPTGTINMITDGPLSNGTEIPSMGTMTFEKIN